MNFINFFRKEEAVNRPKLEFVPKTLADLHVEGGLSDHMNGGNFSLHGKTHFTDTPHTARWHSGGLAVSNCSLFSLFLCHADVYVSLRGSTLINIHIYCICLLYSSPFGEIIQCQIFSMLRSPAQTLLPAPVKTNRLFNFTIYLILSLEILSRLFPGDMNKTLCSHNLLCGLDI